MCFNNINRLDGPISKCVMVMLINYCQKGTGINYNLYSLTKPEKLSINASWFFKYKLLKLNVARVVNIKLFFVDWFYYDLIILIKKCENPYRNLVKVLLFSRDQVFCLKNWKLWGTPTTIKFNVFLLKLCTRFLLINIYKRVFGIFFILFCLNLDIEICKTWLVLPNYKKATR